MPASSSRQGPVLPVAVAASATSPSRGRRCGHRAPAAAPLCCPRCGLKPACDLLETLCRVGLHRAVARCPHRSPSALLPAATEKSPRAPDTAPRRAPPLLPGLGPERLRGPVSGPRCPRAAALVPRRALSCAASRARVQPLGIFRLPGFLRLFPGVFLRSAGPSLSSVCSA